MKTIKEKILKEAVEYCIKKYYGKEDIMSFLEDMLLNAINLHEKHVLGLIDERLDKLIIEIKARKQSYEDKGKIELFWKNEKTNMMLQLKRELEELKARITG